MKADPIAASRFIGVYPSNLLPYELLPRPSSLIINLDPHYREGSHWVCVFIPKHGLAYYFDSFGAPPSTNNIITFLERNSKHGYTYNKFIFQDIRSSVCGYWCILFLLLLHRGIRIPDIYSLFVPKRGIFNDILLLKYISAIINTR